MTRARIVGSAFSLNLFSEKRRGLLSPISSARRVRFLILFAVYLGHGIFHQVALSCFHQVALSCFLVFVFVLVRVTCGAPQAGGLLIGTK